MPIAVLKYDGSGNIGDEIQTIAAEQFLPHIDLRIDRDTLATANVPEQTLLILNGWFAGDPVGSFPPAPSIDPIIYSFHINDRNPQWRHFLAPVCIDYFRHHQPIGCRDRATAEKLNAHGIETFYSKCLTLTLPKRQRSPSEGKVFVVDVDSRCAYIPKHLRSNAVWLTHEFSGQYDDELKRHLAQKTLEIYRDKAELVITTRLHCALPCVAMGIPVIFLGDPENSRTALVGDIGLPIYRFKPPRNKLLRWAYRIYFKFLVANKIDWSPAPLDIEPEKVKIRAKLQKALKERLRHERFEEVHKAGVLPSMLKVGA
jgi:hypothetical protein